MVLAYDRADQRANFSGYVGRLSSNGYVSYGLDGRVFRHDATAVWKSGLNAKRNPSLFESLLRMDATCRRAVHHESHRALPRLPRVWLGFAPAARPEFEITPALERTTVARFELTFEQFRAQSEDVRVAHLHEVWNSLFVEPDARDNPTGMRLIDAEYCSQAHRALRAFEDFRELVGVTTFNPVREVEVLRAANPANELLDRHGLQRHDLADLDQEVVDRLEAEFRALLGDWSERFSQEDLYDALVEPKQPLVAASEVQDRVRRRLNDYWSNCATDDDLRRAIRDPDGPLTASQAPRVQIVRPRGALDLSPKELGRRVSLTWEPRAWPESAES